MTQNNTNKITAAVPHKDEPSKEAQSSESPIESEAVNDSNDDLEIVEEERGVIPPNTVNAAKREEQSVESSSRTRRKSLIDSIKKPFVGMNRRPNREYAFVVGAGLWLALSAGFSNGVCMSGFLLNNHHHNHQEQQQPEGTAAPAVVVYSVAGVTGTCTRSAIFLAKGEFHKMGVDFGIILSVLLGSFLAGYMNPHSVAFELGPRLGPSFVIASGLMTIGAIFATLPLSISVRSNGTLEIYFTAMANGLQNGLISLYSAHMIRTTHLTGTTTNIGLLIGQSFRGNRTNEWRLWILTGLAAAFWTGSLLGYYASRAVHGLALAANAVFFFLIAVALITYFVVVHKISILEALLGVDGGGHCRRGSSASFKRVHIHKETTGEDVSESCLLQMFDDLDKSGLGMVNKDDVLLELAKKHEHMKISRCNLRSIMADLFIVVDSDDDWKISREQWAAMVKGTNNRRSCSLVGPTGIRNQSIVVIQADAGFECKEEEQSNKIDVEER